MELLVTLTLAGWILVGLAVFLGAAVGWSGRVAARAEALQLTRTVWMILDDELRPGVPGRDWALTSDQALELRAFRGIGRVCGYADGRWVVAYRGLRAPDPVRDSVLVLHGDGGWRAADLEGSWSGGNLCELDPGESGRRLAWSAPAGPDPVLVRVFERGRYLLEDGAFRYQRGAGGRQPLTPELVDPWSRFEAHPGGVRVRLRARGWGPTPGGVDFEWVAGAFPWDGT